MKSELVIQLQVCLLLILSLEVVVVVEADAPMISKPGCQDRCGGVNIPFPFGIGVGCFLNDWYEIECKTISPNATKPLLSKFNIEVMGVYMGFLNADDQVIVVGIPLVNVCCRNTSTTQH